MNISKIAHRILCGRYIGNCTNIFDEDTGDCLFDIFRDVSDFACKEEEFRDQLAQGRDSLMPYEDFVGVAGHHSFLKPNMEFYFYEEDGEKNIYVAYDDKKDIHYFFV